MKVVSNASPLVNLARISQLTLLPQLFGRVLIPDAVWQEVVEDGRGQPGADEIRVATWIERMSVENWQLVHSLRQDFDPGEAEAIVLAIETDADWLLMDERLGRETAAHFGLRTVGLVGLLGEAKRQGMVQELRPLLDQLRDVAGFWISSALYHQVVLDAGESS